ncbi:hypothetical protein [Asticcacaulis sp.]|uniref:hypothetical protein n=1 Tax=Asticcacaulis sp. TaxID=1872648 RepID=UPI003F7B6CC5
MVSISIPSEKISSFDYGSTPLDCQQWMIEQAAGDRIEPPVVIIGAGGDIGDGHIVLLA